MNFKKLEVYGFKSFADKLTVEFAPGITAIVGPNGCGKSNVADAIRWALGEQSAKSLRGSQMLDVIFSGTETRKSMSFCEVALHFDNSARIFDCDYDEVVISRKLYRNLESVYSINKQEARLRDVTALLHNSGLGRDSYSIIGQGRIDEILSAKAEDRRAIFEDAAGISKYKHAKIDSERKLERINEKLTRIIDITTEQEKQLKPLALQAENARKAFEIKETLRGLEVNLFLYQTDTAEERKNKVRESITGLNEEFAQLQREYDKANTAYMRALDDTNSLDTKIKELNNERLNIHVHLERQVGEIKLMKSKIAGLREQNILLQDEIERAKKQETDTEGTIEKLSAEKMEMQSAIAEQRRVIDDLSAKYLSVTELLMKNEGEVEEAHRELVASMDKLSEVKANLSALRTEKTALEDRVGDFQQRAEAARVEMAECKGKIDVLTVESNELNARLAQIETDSARHVKAHNESLFMARELSARLTRASGEHMTLEARHKVLSEMVDNMQGYAYSVRKLIADAKADRQLSQRIEGHVSSLIRVKDGLDVAIETALGNAIQNIVVRTEEDAKYLIEYLKNKRYGRATFLPISAVRGKTLDREQRSFLKYKGCAGLASELIEFAPKYQDIFDSLLGKTVIVDTLETAICMAKDAGFAFKIVTLDGDIINPHGAMTGGSRKAETGNILSSERELNEIAKSLEESGQSLEKLTRERDEWVSRQETSEKTVRELTDKKYETEYMLSERKRAIEQYNKRIETLRKTCFDLEQECRKFFRRIEEIDGQLVSVDEIENKITSKRVNADSSNQQNQKQYDVLRVNRDQLHEELTEAKVKMAQLSSRFSAIEQDILRCKSDMVAYSSTVEANWVKISRNNTEIAQSDVDNVEIDSGSETELREKLSVIEGKLGDLDKFKADLMTAMKRHDDVRQNCQLQMSQVAERRSKLEAEIEGIDSSQKYYVDRIAEAYDLDYEGSLKFRVDDFDPEKATVEVNKNRRDLMRLGNVNMHAVEDFEELKKRYDEEMTSKADLEESVRGVKKVISDMTKEMTTRFMDAFSKIRTNFVQCFRSLFGGGNADLILEEGDPLEAGIGILAEPPGKKLQSISLLSGGERALTAIAILFSILMLKPMPFCILDEIEAALDDANVERFAKYLHNFSKNTQFIVITHRKPTMELADSLYGVTMEEKGVSKIVSVKLDDAVRVAETETV